MKEHLSISAAGESAIVSRSRDAWKKSGDDALYQSWINKPNACERWSSAWIPESKSVRLNRSRNANSLFAAVG